MQVAVYGTLRKGQSRNHVLNHSKFLGHSHLPVDVQIYNVGAFPAADRLVHKEPTLPVVCEVYEIDSNTLSILDGIEGHPHFYKREKVDLDNYQGVYVYFLDTDSKYPLIESGDWNDK